MMLINPTMAELKNKAPELEHDGKAVEEKVALPEDICSPLITLKKNAAEVEAAVEN